MFSRGYSGINLQTPKDKNTYWVVSRFCVHADYDRLEEYPLKKWTRRKAKHCFRKGGKYLVRLSKRKASHIFYTDLAKEGWKDVMNSKPRKEWPKNRFKEKIKRCIEVSPLVLAPRARAPRILRILRYVHVGFFRKKLTILSPFLFFSGHKTPWWLPCRKIPENKWFPIEKAENPNKQWF